MGLNNHLYSLLFFIFLLIPISAWSSSILGLNLEDFYGHQKKDRWQNNPFVKPINRVKLDELLLQAIIFSEEEKAVLLNGEVLKIGSDLGEIKILSIHPDYVMIKHPSGVFRLDLKGAGS